MVVQLSAPSIANFLTSQTETVPSHSLTMVPPPPFLRPRVSGICTVCLFVSGLSNLAQFPKVGPHRKPGPEFPGSLVLTNTTLYVCTFFHSSSMCQGSFELLSPFGYGELVCRHTCLGLLCCLYLLKGSPESHGTPVSVGQRICTIIHSCPDSVLDSDSSTSSPALSRFFGVCQGLN